MALRITAIALLIAGLIAWLCMSTPESSKLPVLTPPAPQQGAVGAELQAVALSDDARSEVPSPVQDELSGSIPVLVQDGESGAPVADVEVFSVEWPENSPENYLMHRGERGALGEWIESHGRHTRTNAQGEARLPRANTLSSVYAKHKSRWALKDYVEGDERVVLALVPERALEVHVTSKGGADAKAVDVVFRSLDHFGIQFHSETDDHGIARFRHLEPFMRRDVPEACEVTVCGLFTHKRPRCSFPAQTELPARVELALPPCGSLDVEFVDNHGAPFETKSEFQFVMKGAADVDWVFGSVLRKSPNGRTQVEWVEVGVQIEATAVSLDRRNFARGITQGPTQAGEVVHLRLLHGEHSGSTSPSAIYRAVDEGGGVLANQALRFVARDMNSYHDSEPWDPVDRMTDALGMFDLPFSSDSGEQNSWRAIRVTTSFGERDSELHFVTEFRDAAPANDMLCGDAIFKASQRIVAGRVLDEFGAPASQAQVRVYNSDDEGLTPKRANAVERQMAWGVSDSNGAFEIRGSFPGNAVRVLANPGSPRESPSVVAPTGSSNIVLTVASSGSLEGSIILPEGSIATDVQVQWAGTADTSDGTRDHATNAAEPGLALFRLQDLRAGPGILRVMINASAVETVTDVVVAPGGPTRDPRLQRIDLRDKLRLLRVWVDRPDGTPVAVGTIGVASATAPGARADFSAGFVISHGVASSLVPVGPIDLTIAVENLRNATLLAVTDRELRVRLRPSYEVTLQFRGNDLPGELIARLETTIEPRRNPKHVRGGTRMSVPLEAAGRWKVRLELTGKQVAIGAWQIDVADTDTPQEFVLDVDPKLIEQALR